MEPGDGTLKDPSVVTNVAVGFCLVLPHTQVRAGGWHVAKSLKAHHFAVGS